MTRRIMLTAPTVLLAACSGKRRSALPELGTVPPFQLTDQNGTTFDSTVLDGKVWVADFMFTACNATCPRQSTQLKRLQEATAGWRDLHLVSFTVDVKKDTPEVLAAYAKRYGADPERWHFLTGPEETLNRLAFDVFHVGTVDGSREHSSRLLLVDRNRTFRATYTTGDEEGFDRLLVDLKGLD